MGLDMYLRAEISESNYEWERGESGDNEVFTSVINAIGAENVYDQSNPFLEVSLSVGYWRKANAIHNWFVENVQDGEDNCHKYSVSKEQLKELVSLCIEVVNDHSKAEKLLPTSEGFFFGSTDYNEFYFMELKRTASMLKVLINKAPDTWSFSYQSSW